jgi:hypothetical protein
MSFPIYYRTPSLGGVIMGGGGLFAVAFWLFSRLDADSSMWSIAWREMVMVSPRRCTCPPAAPPAFLLGRRLGGIPLDGNPFHGGCFSDEPNLRGLRSPGI